MSIKIKRVLENEQKFNGAFEIIGKKLKNKSGEVYTLIDCDDDDDFPYLVEEDKTGNLLKFNKNGMSSSGKQELCEESLLRLKTSYVISKDDWEEAELNEDFSNIKEVLESYGYKERIFAVITDKVSNLAEPPIQEMSETHNLKTEWVLRIDKINDEDEFAIIPCDRVIGIMSYINKDTRKVDLKHIFIVFYDPEQGYCSSEQFESIRPATEDEIELWAESGKEEYKEFEFIPLLINENGTFKQDPRFIELEELLKNE